MKKLTAFALFCIICFSSQGQIYMPVLENGKPKIFDWPVVMTRVYFNIADSTYDYTLFREPDGLFYFRQGSDHVDDSLSMVMLGMSQIDGKHKRKDTLEVKTYEPSYHWTTNAIHTTSRFMPFITGPESFINTQEEKSGLIPFIKELSYTAAQDSLHLQGISKLPANNVIRLTRIDSRSGWLGPTTIQFYEIDMDDPAAPKIRYIEAQIDSSLKCKNSLDLDFGLNKRDTKTFMKSVRSMENEKITFITKPGLNEPYLIEVRRGEEHTVFERSSGINPDRDFRSEYCDILWYVEKLRKQYEKKQARE